MTPLTYFAIGFAAGLLSTLALLALIVWRAIQPPKGTRYGSQRTPPPFTATDAEIQSHIARMRLRGVDLPDTPDGRDRPSTPPRSA